jgi:hypothetical protein
MSGAKNWLLYIGFLVVDLVCSLPRVDFNGVVLGTKETYGGGLFVRESNNTLIFVRSNYRVP